MNGVTLTSANLTKANLQNSILRNAYLGNANLSYTNLKNSILSGARLHETNFSYANLSHASLSHAQTINANFHKAILTGACLQDFYYDYQTNFERVDCDYFYQKEIYIYEEKKYKFEERRPHDFNKLFKIGEFTKLFQKALETVELVFSDGINWQAFLYSFQKLKIECNSEELAIQGIERKSGGAFVIRVEVPLNVDKAKIEKYIHNQYEIKLKSIEDNYKLQLGAKAEQIALYRQHNTDLLEIIKNQPINITMSNINQSHSGSGDNVGRDKNTTNIYNSQDLTQAAADIQALLEQLDKTYNPNTTTGKMTIATKAIEKIDNNINLTKRIISALKSGSISAIESLLNHPAASFFIAALEDWQQTKQ